MVKKIFWLIIAILVISALVAGGGGYFLLRSDHFVRAYLFPYISKSTGATISATNASIAPFSEISFKDLRINCKDKSGPCNSDASFSLAADSLKVNYDIWKLLSRRLSITSLSGQAVRVSLIEKSRATAPNSEAPKTAAASSRKADSDNKPGLVIQIANAALTDSSFQYLDPINNSSYSFDEIKIEVPQGDSNAESKLKLSTLVPAKSADISLKRELVSGTVIIQDASLFAPRTLQISAKAGSATPTPIELAGSLQFSHSRDTLESIVVTNATIRDSLLTLLGASATPIKEFELEVKGRYPLSNSTPIDIAINTIKAIAPSSADLKGTTISSKLVLGADTITIERGEINLIANSEQVAKAEISGSAAFDPYKKRSSLNIHAQQLNADLLEALFRAPIHSGSENPLSSPTATPTAKAAPASAASSPESPAKPLQLPLIDASVKIDQAIYQKLAISKIAAEISIPNSKTIKNASLNATFDGAGTFSASASGALDGSLNLKANANKINVLPLAALAQGEGELLEGIIDRLNLNLDFTALSPRTTLTGRSELEISRFIVPSTLQSQVPFNILFLPFDALITVFGGTINAILPKSISSISDGIRQVLDDAGRLGIDRGTIDLDFEQGKISCRNVDIDTKNLPDFTIKGNVSASDKLDFTIFIGLLKLNLPLPVAGTLSTPLPDIAYLAPEIVRGLGLSIGNIAGGLVSIIGGEGPKDKKATNSAP